MTDDGTGPTTLAATVTSQSSDTADAEQRGLVVTLFKPSALLGQPGPVAPRAGRAIPC
ncbi:hypothetical protein [Streptomyces sp. NPDC004008]